MNPDMELRMHDHLTQMPKDLPGGLDAYHADLLTVLIALMLAWALAGAWAERRRVPWTTGKRGSDIAVMAVLGVPWLLIVGALVIGQPYLALYFVQWLIAAYGGVRCQRLVTELRRSPT